MQPLTPNGGKKYICTFTFSVVQTHLRIVMMKQVKSSMSHIFSYVLKHHNHRTNTRHLLRL